MSTVAPRVVIVTRPTPLEQLVASHGTLGQARFFLKTRGRPIEPLIEMRERQVEAMKHVRGAIPRAWRSVGIDRAELSRFVFEPEDVVVAVGQDGLVANVAKYLREQRVIGVNPDPERVGGVLVRHAPGVFEGVLYETVKDAVGYEERTMVEARTDDGQVLHALNEVFVGHRTHQSARYTIRCEGTAARHSSSGVIVATGTGATGWARSIHRERELGWELPEPEAPSLAYLVREAWPSVATSTELTGGLLSADSQLELTSEMNDDGVLFGDGIEDDAIHLRYGASVTIACAQHRLRLVV